MSRKGANDRQAMLAASRTIPEPSPPRAMRAITDAADSDLIDPFLMWTPGYYAATYLENHDGDTALLRIILPRRMFVETEIRLVGPPGVYFNAPEIDGPNAAKAIEARDRLKSLLIDQTLYLIVGVAATGEWLMTYQRVAAKVLRRENNAPVNVSVHMSDLFVKQGQ